MTTPFALASASYPGAMPDAPADWDYVPARFWIGQPGTMIELPSLDPSNYTVTGSRSRVEQGLGAGASGFTELGTSTRRWGLSWQRLASRDLDRLDALDAGMYGDELVYVQPEDRNHLTRAQSMCGSLNGTAEGWTAVTNQPTYDATLNPPIEPSGVLRWTPASASDALFASYGSTTVPSGDYGVPYLPAEYACWSFYACVTSSTSQVTPAFVGRSATGQLLASTSGPPVTLTTSWQQIQLAIAPGFFSGALPYLMPALQGSNTNEVQIACAQFEYRPAPTEWTTGRGVARVGFAADFPRQLDVFRNSQIAVTLAETVAGAC